MTGVGFVFVPVGVENDRLFNGIKCSLMIFTEDQRIHFDRLEYMRFGFGMAFHLVVEDAQTIFQIGRFRMALSKDGHGILQ